MFVSPVKPACFPPRKAVASGAACQQPTFQGFKMADTETICKRSLPGLIAGFAMCVKPFFAIMTGDGSAEKDYQKAVTQITAEFIPSSEGLEKLEATAPFLVENTPSSLEQQTSESLEAVKANVLEEQVSRLVRKFCLKNPELLGKIEQQAPKGWDNNEVWMTESDKSHVKQAISGMSKLDITSEEDQVRLKRILKTLAAKIFGRHFDAETMEMLEEGIDYKVDVLAYELRQLELHAAGNNRKTGALGALGVSLFLSSFLAVGGAITRDVRESEKP